MHNFSATVSIIKDLKLIKMGKTSIFENTVKHELTDILSNEVITPKNLALHYTLASLQTKSRDELRKIPKWSSKLELDYLNHNYNSLLKNLKQHYDSYGQF